MNNKGFAVTGFLYSILVLFIVIATLLIFNLQNKKVILDKLKSDALDNLENNINEGEEICSYEVGQEFTFDYTGSEQTFTVPCSGYYKLETWGAQGGDISGIAYNADGTVRSNYIKYSGGTGGYTSGTINLNKNNSLYVYVGSKPNENTTLVGGTIEGGYNGGMRLLVGQEIYGAPGGGATDIRISNGVWNDLTSLSSRIIVAAGGGGANFRNQGYGEGNGGEGGGLIGLSGHEALSAGSYHRSDYAPGYYIGEGGTQTNGGGSISFPLSGSSQKNVNKANVDNFGQYKDLEDQSGGGGGYYPGGGIGHGGAGGGSSYISGHTGCVAITSETDQSPKNGCKTGTTNNACSKHYSGLVFTDTNMIDGAGHTWTNSDIGVNSINLMPKPSGGYYASGTGHIGNGYAKITYLGKKKNAGKTKYTITNMISNGSFEDDFDNFTYKADNASISSTESAYGNKSYKRGTSTKAGGTTQYINVVEGHKYYYFLHSKSGSVTLWSDVSNTGWGAIQSKSTDWNKFGIIIKATTTAKKNISLNYGDDITEDTYVDGVGFVDLTEAFGAGNEPSKEWCDIHIDYFDGTKTIYK